MKNTVILLFSIIVMESCQPIMMKLYGIKNPGVENEKTITKKALKLQLDTSCIVTVNSKDFLYLYNGQNVPDASIYDKSGQYIEYRKTDTSCNAGLFSLIPSLNLTDIYNKPEHDSLNSELNKYRDLKGNKLPVIEKADFYLLIYWTAWIGKLNKDHVKAWENLAYENKNCKIKVIKVNLDFQEYWDSKERENIISEMKKSKSK